MTDPKNAESRAGASRSKPAATTAAKADRPVPERSTKDPSVAADSTHHHQQQQNPVLDQLVALTRSISDLVRQNVAADDGETPSSDESAQQARVGFAYDFLGVALGRRAPSVFQLKTVTVNRDPGTLTFTGLEGATVAKIRGANNKTQVLEGLQDGVPAPVATQGENAIPDAVPIDSIVTFTVTSGVRVPVAIGDCDVTVGGPIFE